MLSPKKIQGALSVNSVSLNALRAFEAAARHLSFTRAGLELSVTQAAVSHQVKGLEDRLGVALFRRTASGLVLTDEGTAMLPSLSETFDRLNRLLVQFDGGRVKETLTVSVVGTFAVWLHGQLPDFVARHPFIDLRLLTNNNRVDLAGESLDYAIRFGVGAWHGTYATKIMDAPLSPLCSPRAAVRLNTPADLRDATLLRSYRTEDWPTWLAVAGVEGVVARGPQFDSSSIMVQVAIQSEAVALAPASMFDADLTSGRLVQPFDRQIDVGAYWLTRLVSRQPTAVMIAFADWLTTVASGEGVARAWTAGPSATVTTTGLIDDDGDRATSTPGGVRQTASVVADRHQHPPEFDPVRGRD